MQTGIQRLTRGTVLRLGGGGRTGAGRRTSGRRGAAARCDSLCVSSSAATAQRAASVHTYSTLSAPTTIFPSLSTTGFASIGTGSIRVAPLFLDLDVEEEDDDDDGG